MYISANVVLLTLHFTRSWKAFAFVWLFTFYKDTYF